MYIIKEEEHKMYIYYLIVFPRKANMPCILMIIEAITSNASYYLPYPCREAYISSSFRKPPDFSALPTALSPVQLPLPMALDTESLRAAREELGRTSLLIRESNPPGPEGAVPW
jgi:hypothetical protein